MIKNIIKKIENDSSSLCLVDEPLKKHTTYGIGGPADLMVFPNNKEDVIRVIEIINENNMQLTILVSGKNEASGKISSFFGFVALFFAYASIPLLLIPNFLNRLPTALETAPPTPASTSSKIRVGTGSAVASAALRARRSRDLSPPDAILLSGPGTFP